MSSTRPTPYIWVICLITIGFLTVYVATVISYTRQIEGRDKRINTLTYEVTLLTKENRDLRNSIEALNSIVRNLTAEIYSLRSNYSGLLNKYNEINRSYSALEEKYVALLTKHNETSAKLQLLEEIVNLKKNKTLASFMGVATANHTVMHRIDYAGYIIVSFKSNTSIYIVVENRFGDRVFTTRVPIDAPINSGEFLIPVIPGQLVLRFTTIGERYFSIKYEVIYVY